MNKATRFFALTTVSLSMLSVYLAWSLRAERGQVAVLQAMVRELSRPASTAQKNGNAPRGEAGRPHVEGEHAVNDLPPEQGELPDVTKHDASPRPLKSASHREADLAYRRLEVQKQYPDLETVLNLQPDETSSFIDLLARQQVDDAAWEMSSEAAGQSTQVERRRREQANQAEQTAFLGAARAADWNKYTNSLPARKEIRELRVALADSDFPLRRDQYEPLVTLIAKEQIRHIDDREKLRSNQRDPENPTPQETIAYMDKRLDLIEESLARRRRAAASILDSEQLKRYEAMLEQERLRAKVDYESMVTLVTKSRQ